MTLTVRRHDGDTIAFAVLLLFFFQLLSEFVEAIYAFGLLGTGIPSEIAAVLLLFAPVLLLLVPQTAEGRAARLLPWVIIVCRLVAVLVNTRARLIISGVGVGSSLLWLPSELHQLGSGDADGDGAHHLGLGLLVALMLSVALRAAGSGLDVSTRGISQLIGWLLAGVAVLALTRRERPTSGPARAVTAAGSFGRLVVLTLGLSSALILSVFVFASPNVVARWTEANYLAVIITLVVGMVGYVVARALGLGLPARARRGLLWAANLLFVVALTVTLRTHQLRFPSDPAGYPSYAPDVALIHQIPLFVTLLLVPCIVADFSLYVREIVASRPSPRTLGGAFTVSSLFWLLMIFGHVFTTVYDYIPVVGPAFRDGFWWVHLAAGLGVMLPLLAVRRAPSLGLLSPVWVGAIALLGVVAVGAVLVTAARPGEPVPASTLTVLTYNIQQGYTADGQKGVDDQLAVLRAVDADLIGLQESDTNRISGGNADIVRYFADALDMHATYGPTTVVGTFGIALLSKYPIEQPRTFFMYSEGEQTATIEARIRVGEVAYDVFVTHLGNGGPIVQQEAVLKIVQGRQNVILMGDFNFRPETPQYALTTARFDDAWLRRWPEGVDDQGARPAKRIDHIFISPELQVEDARYLDGPASDHPALMAILRVP